MTGDSPDPAAGPKLLWYAAYGSNLHLARLTAYLAGGRPLGGARDYPGCRDPRPPRDSRAIRLPGRLYFALESTVWTGGMAFYDPAATTATTAAPDTGSPGHDGTAARAYLITAAQLSDLAAQEMRRPPGTDLDLRQALREGRAVLGPGRYDTLIHPGDLEGRPLLTFTAPWPLAEAPLNPPSARYLHHLAAGLREAHGWRTTEIAAYLSTRPGAAGHWSPQQLTDLLT
ncbi:histone deacetylase [Kitasatospora sp. NBC_01250]|uniref:histone deacetylase n=1 Tax=Kitasatospora sp. NBC_01250 TaxID=2903571 RepID=UPI002E2EC404|nr:histone deacetylase [Kitasatospora sp. NBC_01250]